MRRTAPTWATPTVFLALAVPFLMVLANENLFVVYGAWLEEQFGLTVAAIGVVSLVISIADDSPHSPPRPVHYDQGRAVAFVEMHLLAQS